MLERLREPDSVKAFIEAQQKHLRDDAKARAGAERAVARAQGAIDRLSRALISERIDEAFFDREIGPLRAALAAAKAKMETAPAPELVALHPAALRVMDGILSILADNLATLDPVDDAEMFLAFRALIERVVIKARPDGDVDCEIHGALAPLLAPDGGEYGQTLVARGGLDPPTP